MPCDNASRQHTGGKDKTFLSALAVIGKPTRDGKSSARVGKDRGGWGRVASLDQKLAALMNDISKPLHRSDLMSCYSEEPSRTPNPSAGSSMSCACATSLLCSDLDRIWLKVKQAYVRFDV